MVGRACVPYDGQPPVGQAGRRSFGCGTVSVGMASVNLVPMRLRRIIINELKDQQLIELREIDGSRRFTIVIGLFEATSIDRRVKKWEAPRPLTHDLIVAVIEQMGGELLDVVINELRDHTYYAQLRIETEDGIEEIDCRPSDAIAVAVTGEMPIYVDEAVLEASVQ